MNRVVVGVSPSSEHARYAKLFEALEQLFAVSFRACPPGEFRGLKALILPAGNREAAVNAAQCGVPSYLVQSGKSATLQGVEAAVEFSRTEHLAPVLRGQMLVDPGTREFVPLALQPGEEIMATRAGHVLWSHRPSSRGTGAIDTASLPLSELKEGGYLREVFNGYHYMGLLPLIHFLQRITQGRSLQAPPLRACFVFDDPNLRWRSYGCINFRDLAEHARACHYHAAIGVVPSDAAWASSGVVSLFKAAPRHLSLVVHGSRHLYLEMARDCPDAEQMAVLAQAVRRVENFERRHGLMFCRVMESPYGALTGDMFKPLLALGYEAAMLTTLQFLSHNRALTFPAVIGAESAAFLPGGLGLIPRIKMSPWWKTEALQAALLGQPIVIAGHHYNAANGLTLMGEIAAVINRFGPMNWCRLGEIARSNFAWHVEDGVMKVRAASRRLQISIPEGVEEIQVERPWLLNGELEPLTLTGSQAVMTANQRCARFSVPVAVKGERSVEVLSPAPGLIDPKNVPLPRMRVWPMARRILTETRDRAYPYFHKLFSRPASRGAPLSRFHS